MVQKKANILDRIRANQGQELRSRNVKAWSSESDNFMVYWLPLTLEEKQKIARYAQGDDHLTTLFTVIFKACDEAGDKLFNVGDKSELMKFADARGIEEIALDILGITDEEMTPEKLITTLS